MFDLVPKQRRRRLRSHQVGCVLRFARPRMVGPYIFFNHMSALLPPGVPPTKDVRTASAYRLVDLLSGESLPRDSVRSELLITCDGTLAQVLVHQIGESVDGFAVTRRSEVAS